MQLGWIDFSKDERDKVLDVINLLTEDGAVDELGIGVIRDNFANLFFPGTSTVQTRAKYFLIVPYVLREAGSGNFGNNPNDIIKKIDENEKQCALKLLENDRDGVIGARNLPKKWVARKPSNIYWNGIRTFKIFKNDVLSIKEYVKMTCIIRIQKKSAVKLGNRNDQAEENEKDDKNAGDIRNFNFWHLPDICYGDWRENLKIQLLKEEAEFLRNQIETVLPDTLFADLVKNNVNVDRYSSFESLYEGIKDKLPEHLRKDMRMAIEFNKFIQMAFIQYNLIISNDHNKIALDKWNDIKESVKKYANINLNEIYLRFGITKSSLTAAFLNNLKESWLKNDVAEIRSIIRERENNIKGRARAKVNMVGEFDKSAWIGMDTLDYRLGSAKRIINDIYEGEVVENAQN